MSKKKETVYLVDGSSYIHRAFHAIRNLANSKGLPTNAAFGFTKMILKLLADRAPKYMAIAFDVRGPTFRHRIYEDYKANRPPMPEDMAVQIPLIKKIVKDLNLEMIEKQGYEADDIIGTLARICEEKGFQVVMVTGDKDFRQLITPNITMWDTMKDVVSDVASLKETYGLEPEQFIEVMGLSGDSTDNIPGVPGVGEKTALALIREFGSFDGVFDRVEEIKKKKLKENLQQSRDKALLSRKLVAIDRFVPLDQDMERLKVGQPRNEALARTFRDLEFRGLWDQFAARKEEEAVDYGLCLSREVLEALVKEIREAGMVSLDTETTSQDPLRAELVGISFALKEGRAWYVPLSHN
ncbi:MAG: DNA polymerase I, partial [Deltaproteobacteria bacterium]|nr:DNA polymerase I [Deltaproteobacteria bacterium]